MGLDRNTCKGCIKLVEKEFSTGDQCGFWHELLRCMGSCQFIGKPDKLAEAIERNKSFKGVW